MVNDKTLVSVLMVAYNHSAFIGAAIESVLSSTYSDFELIVVDDHSPDNTYNIALGYAAKDDRVRVYRNEKNLGDYPNRNKAASYALGYYLKYLDGDDVIYPNSLQVMVAAMEQYPAAGLGLQQQVTDDITPYPILAPPQQSIRMHFLERGVLNSGPSGAILKRSLFNELGGFSNEKFVGDSELWIRIGFHYSIVFLQPSLVWWRIHEAQESRNEAKDRNMLLVRYTLYKNFLADPACPLSDEDRRMALLKLNRRYLVNVFRKFKKGEGLRYTLSLIKKASFTPSSIFHALFH